MNDQFLKFRTNHVLGLITAFSFGISSPALWAEQHPGYAGGQQGSMQPMDKSDDSGQAWAMIQQLVKDMDTAVQSKNLHGIHDPSMKIRAPIKTLKQHSSTLSGDKGSKMTAALKQLDSAITDLHSAVTKGTKRKRNRLLRKSKPRLINSSPK